MRRGLWGSYRQWPWTRSIWASDGMPKCFSFKLASLSVGYPRMHSEENQKNWKRSENFDRTLLFLLHSLHQPFWSHLKSVACALTLSFALISSCLRALKNISQLFFLLGRKIISSNDYLGDDFKKGSRRLQWKCSQEFNKLRQESTKHHIVF